MLQNVASEQGLHYLPPIIQQFVDMLTGSKMDQFKFQNKYGERLRVSHYLGLIQRYLLITSPFYNPDFGDWNMQGFFSYTSDENNYVVTIH